MMDTSCTYIEGGDRSFGKSGAVPYVFSTQDAFADVSFIMPLRCFLDPSMQALLAALPDERDSRTDLVRSTPPCSRRFRRPHRPRRPRRPRCPRSLPAVPSPQREPSFCPVRSQGCYLQVTTTYAAGHAFADYNSPQP